ncbi:MAG: C39 family peptidase [Candidatus Moranbacteria bacterium]|nr:C39 family peptidase [Candidatus Moranbacteria bacterium]
MRKIHFFLFLIILGGGAYFFYENFPSENIFSDNQERIEVRQESLLSEALSEEVSQVIPEEIPARETKESLPKDVLLEDVPFTSQAPFGEWSNPMFQDGCEEASLTMVRFWLTREALTGDVAKKEIVSLAKFTEKKFGHAIDTSVADTERIFNEYYGYNATKLHYDIELGDIRRALGEGKLVIVPAHGQKLKNPNFTRPGPITHMLVVIGYDTKKKQFITNDPGTKNGKGYRYDEDVFYGALQDYPTGDHVPSKKIRKAMMTIAPNEEKDAILEKVKK